MAEISGWYLHGYVDGEQLPRRILITSIPFRMERADDVGGRVPLHHISELHAEVYRKRVKATCLFFLRSIRG